MRQKTSEQCRLLAQSRPTASPRCVFTKHILLIGQSHDHQQMETKKPRSPVERQELRSRVLASCDLKLAH